MSTPSSIGPRLLIGWLLAALSVTTSLPAQQTTVQGTVLNEATGAPIAGAAVVVQGTAIGTTTNASGEFTLTVPSASATLTVRHLGYERRDVPLNGQSRVVVRLEGSAVLLDEVVVVGYGTQRRRDVTGSVASVGPERLENLPTTNVAQAIQGAVPGVSITTTAAGAEQEQEILIRGENSLLASSSPLIVLDGIPYSGNLSEINQADIASIDVLKDASSAAIYGSRGSNGVILITSKKGRGAPRFSYDGYVGVQEVANLPRMMTGEEFGRFKCERNNGGTPCEDALIDQFLTPSELEMFRRGESTDWLDLITQQGRQQQHNLSVSGGAGGTRYYLAGSLLDVRGVARNDQFNRYNMRFNLDQEVSSWLEAGTSTQLGWTDRGGIAASFSGAIHQNPLSRPFQDDGSQMIYPWPEDTFFPNPLQGLLAVNDDVARRVFTSNYVQLGLPIEGLTYRLNGGMDFGDRSRSTYWGRDTNQGESFRGDASTADSDSYDWTIENLLRFNRTFGPHALDLTGLYSAQQFRFQERRLTARDNPGDELAFWQPEVSKAVTPGATFRQSGMVSQMGRINYSYDGRYLVTLTARRDGSSVFGENYKHGVFPSVALGWNVASEPFWRFADAVSTLKLRASWGINGNQAIAPFQTLSRLGGDSYVDGGVTAPGYIPVALGNPDLRWEKSTTLNLGADFGLLQDRVSGSLEIYRTSTTDLLLDRLIPSTHGIERITTNMGEVQNEGVELSVSTINWETGDFSWRTDFNISANRNKIVDLYADGSDDLVNGWFVGHPIHVNFGYVHDGIWQVGDPITSSAQPTALPGDVRIRDSNADGRLNADDRMIFSDPNADYLAGMNNILDYGPVSLSFFLHAVQGTVRHNELIMEDVYGPTVRRSRVYNEYWTPDNRSNFLPANRENTESGFDIRYFQDASFIRLKDVMLSYVIPSGLYGGLGLSNLKVYVAGRNLWTGTDWYGLDPELDDQFSQPLERTFTAGVNLAF